MLAASSCLAAESGVASQAAFSHREAPDADQHVFRGPGKPSQAAGGLLQTVRIQRAGLA